MEAGRSYKGDELVADNALFGMIFYRRINVTNIILDEIEDLNPATEEERLDALRVRGGNAFFTCTVLFPACKHLCSGLRSGKMQRQPWEVV